MTQTTKWIVGLLASGVVAGGAILLYRGRRRRVRSRQLGAVTPGQRRLTKAYLAEARRALRTLETKTEAVEASLRELKSLAGKTSDSLARRRETTLYENDAWTDEPDDDVNELRDQLEEVSAPNGEYVDGAIEALLDDWKAQLQVYRRAIQDAEE